jgi:NAD(P)-dependent dehydrogenase (short-subunit alcohol dehydrogenase family)
MLRQSSGSIINVPSHAGLMGSVRPLYAAAKGGLNAFTRTLAAQYSEHGIRANAIASGTVRSARSIRRHEGRPTPEAAERATLRKLYPFSIGEPEDMAALAVFLASDESRMITGATIQADGGRSSYLRVLAHPDAAPNDLDGD